MYGTIWLILIKFENEESIPPTLEKIVNLVAMNRVLDRPLEIAIDVICSPTEYKALKKELISSKGVIHVEGGETNKTGVYIRLECAESSCQNPFSLVCTVCFSPLCEQHARVVDEKVFCAVCYSEINPGTYLLTIKNQYNI